ncbi:MAG: leucine--tRNA ligase [Bacteroidetes bacterium]|nr:leucine--tRNA ligase [Bacteroidota bacterium]
MEYKFSEIEVKWKGVWEKNGLYKVTEDSSKPKFYVLDMFPYPSGSGLHVGHPLGYVASDIYARYKRMKGFNVLHPMGYDAFGIPAEQYAIETGTHPAVTTEKAVKRYREQLDKIGFSFDWSREVKTCDPSYYKWTQWIFLKLFNSWYNREKDKAEAIESLIEKFTVEGSQFTTEGKEKKWDELSESEQQKVLMGYRLAYISYAEVNWCAALGTVLANDEVKDGKSERGGHPVERKKMRQWFLRITEYSDRLLEGLENLDWTESMKDMQRNWIGRSEGALVNFHLSQTTINRDKKMAAKVPPSEGFRETLTVFTTRPDTIFGATFMVIAPEHDLVDVLTTKEQKTEIDEYITYVKSRSDVDRQQEKKVTGAFTGSYAINPFTEKPIPIYIAEYVLAGYGTGAIMAVPADDERDRKFAEKFDLPIIDVVDRSMYPNAKMEDKLGKLINSGILNGMEVKEAIQSIISEIERRGIGEKKVNYKQRDASFSRQRYWGEPFPIKYTTSPNPSEGGENKQPRYHTADGQTWEHNLELAKENRKNPTEAEQIIWDRLKNKQTGYKFRRQWTGIFQILFVCKKA